MEFLLYHSCRFLWANALHHVCYVEYLDFKKPLEHLRRDASRMIQICWYMSKNVVRREEFSTLQLGKDLKMSYIHNCFVLEKVFSGSNMLKNYFLSFDSFFYSKGIFCTSFSGYLNVVSIDRDVVTTSVQRCNAIIFQNVGAILQPTR